MHYVSSPDDLAARQYQTAGWVDPRRFILDDPAGQLHTHEHSKGFTKGLVLRDNALGKRSVEAAKALQKVR